MADEKSILSVNNLCEIFSLCAMQGIMIIILGAIRGKKSLSLTHYYGSISKIIPL